MNEELFQSTDALTFDDLLVVPAYTEVLPAETQIRTRLAANIHLNIPILSAAMDTVTEARLAIALAREGGPAAVVLREAECDGDRLFETASALRADPERLRAMRAAASGLSVVDAAEQIYRTALGLVRTR